MSLTVVSLGILLSNDSEANIQKILNTFQTKLDCRTGDQNDVEDFLKRKSIHFEKIGIAATYLVFAPFRNSIVLVGYFSIANKPLMLSNKLLKSFSNTQKTKFLNRGYREHNGEKNSSLVVPALLIGQLGRNFHPDAVSTKSLTGTNLVALAEEKIWEVARIMNSRYVWLECKDETKLLDFYKNNGYIKVEDYITVNGLRLLIKQINKIV